MWNALTPRQRQLLLLRARGYSNAEACEQLGIARQTAHRHLTLAYERLGIAPYTECSKDGCLHLAWRRLGWLVPPDD